MEYFIAAIAAVCVINMVLLVLVFKRQSKQDVALLVDALDNLGKNDERLERVVRDESAKSREEQNRGGAQAREELRESIAAFSQSLRAQLSEVANLQKNHLDSFSQQLASLTQMNEQKLDKIRETVEGRLHKLQVDNTSQLERMRETVDEKLHSTLEKRLGESFQMVSDRLEKVHVGLGEMQSLASGVGDLKKVLTNVKTRGTWGEVQLGNLLEQMLTKDQYDTNVEIKKGSREVVEFAIKLPGRDKDPVYLPIDAKFPSEDYERLVIAQEAADLVAIEEAGKKLEQCLKFEARKIRDKYISPPRTTDFGILFVPIEGLYAEILRRPGLCDSLQRDFRVTVSGPTTIGALLNSLQLGFRTLAVEKHASQVWTLLGVVKTEFGKFGDILTRTQEKLSQASKTIERAASKSRNIERKLTKVQSLPTGNVDETEDSDERKLMEEPINDDAIL